MRSDFRSSDNQFFNKEKKSSGFPRLLKTIIFISIGIAIGFWINHKFSNNTEQPKPPALAASSVDATQTQADKTESTISLPVELPVSKS